MQGRGRCEDDPLIVADELEGGFSISENGILLYRKAVAQAGQASSNGLTRTASKSASSVQ